MEKLKIDFKIDVLTGEEIPVAKIKEELKQIKKKKNYYFSEIADHYYQQKYGENIVQVLSEIYDIPKCPVTGDLVSYKLTGSLLFGKYSSSCSVADMAKHIAENNESYQAHIERMKIERKGEGNPMYGATAWNDGLTKDTDERIRKISEGRKGIEFSEETLAKMSESAKIREVHGHTGHKHSEETKQKLREITAARYKNGIYPQTDSLPHRETRSVLEGLNMSFEEEFEYGGFVFDFKVGDKLIEVQGDYFHCNPNTRHAVPKNKMQENNLKRDKRKRKFVEDNKEFGLLEVWEYDIINKKDEIKLWLSNLKE